MVINIICNVGNLLYSVNNKYYIDLLLSDEDMNVINGIHVANKHRLLGNIIQNPLSGNILKVKIPFRYRRLMCIIEGEKTLYELIVGDSIKVSISYEGVWNTGDFSGFAWKLIKLRY